MRNKILFLSLACLALFVVNARAAATPKDGASIEMPAFVVEAPRYLPAEKDIAAALRDLRREARAPVGVFAELPALPLHAAAVHARHDAKTAPQAEAGRKAGRS
ncbi:MAG: hypothetical protein HY302_15540 [Opitutae bacterium]|nr:hypothetical protein [Opitutae bacterium]